MPASGTHRRTAAASGLRPVHGNTLRDLPAHALPHQSNLHDRDPVTALRVLRHLDAAVLVLNLTDAFPAVLTPILGIVVVHGLSSSRSARRSPHRTGIGEEIYARLPKNRIAKAERSFSARFSADAG